MVKYSYNDDQRDTVFYLHFPGILARNRKCDHLWVYHIENYIYDIIHVIFALTADMSHILKSN